MTGRRLFIGMMFWLVILWVLVSLAVVIGVLLGGLLLSPVDSAQVPPTVVEPYWSDVPEPRPFVPVVIKKPRPVTRHVARVVYVETTAYCACPVCTRKPVGDPRSGITATGAVARAGRTIATDWKYLPKGTRVRIEGFGDTVFVVEDTFGSVRRPGRIDIFFSSHSAALEFGRRRGVRVEILD